MPVATQGETAKSSASGDQPGPVILDLGKKKRKAVKQLRNGKGRLLDEAMDSMEELQRVGTVAQSAQLVIVIVREKPKSSFPMMRF